MKKEGTGLLILGKKLHFVFGKRAQVWIETVMYILIATIMIGLVISFVGPKISQMQDKAVLENSAIMLNELDNIISSIVQDGSGNIWKVEIPLKKGNLIIDGVKDQIIFEMEGTHAYSEPGKEIKKGSLIIYTKQTGNLNIVNMTVKYPSYNITFEGKKQVKSITQSTTPYTLRIFNNMRENNQNINFELI